MGTRIGTWKNFKCPSPLHIASWPREGPEFSQVPQSMYRGTFSSYFLHTSSYFFFFIQDIFRLPLPLRPTIFPCSMSLSSSYQGSRSGNFPKVFHLSPFSRYSLFLVWCALASTPHWPPFQSLVRAPMTTLDFFHIFFTFESAIRNLRTIFHSLLR